MQPGMTHLGAPMQVMKMGRTELPLTIIMDYLESMKEIYSIQVCKSYLINVENTLMSGRRTICGPTTAITSQTTLRLSSLERESQVISPISLIRS